RSATQWCPIFGPAATRGWDTVFPPRRRRQRHRAREVVMKRLFGVFAAALLLLAVPVAAHAGQYKGKAKEGAGASKTMTATGTVKTVSADSLTITTKTGDETFAVDSKTNVTASGASHKTEAMKSEKKATQITDFV